MNLSDQQVLSRLGNGQSIESVCAEADLPRGGFDAWWNEQLALRLPETDGTRKATVRGDVEILRDDWGIPHIFAGQDEDLFFGYGFALAQDRLWQLDYLRRKAMGRLAEVLGPSALEQDTLVRTVGINRIAAQQVERLPSDTTNRLESFSHGINSVLKDRGRHLPIEFDLLGYDPEPWSPLDSVAIWAEFRWYLTGRLPVIALPELAKRTLGDGPLYSAFLTPEAGEESIMPRGSYPPSRPGVDPVGEVVGGPDEGLGSNNWVVAGKRAAGSAPLLASDPHIAFGAASCWYEVHLDGAGFNVAGASYVGVPAVLFGRNTQVAWGITNNICSQRDLYSEKTDPQHPGCFLYDGKWEPATERTEPIAVKGEEPLNKTVRFSRNGPIVNEVLPAPLRDTGAVSLRWLGTTFSDELSCLLAANQAGSCDEFRAALKDWHVPTFSFVFADIEGHIGYQCVGRIPIRNSWDRGFRPGWDPDQRWQGLIPFDGMPALADPPEGWVRTANNRTAPDDYPYPLSGTWSSGHRALRVRQMIEEKEKLSRKDFAKMQMDVLSLRAVEAVPNLVRILAGSSESRVTGATSHLERWDCRMEPDRVGAAIFELFFQRWCEAVAAERFQGNAVPLMAAAISGLALELLSEDRHRWFTRANREEAVLGSLALALDDLETRLGPDMSRWSWGGVHKINLRHYLSGRGDISRLLSRGGQPVRGSGTTVCNTGYDPNYMASMGANYRLIADLGDGPPGMWAVSASGQSGQPGSPHYCDQLEEWLAGRHHYLPLDRKRAEAIASSRLVLEPTQ